MGAFLASRDLREARRMPSRTNVAAGFSPSANGAVCVRGYTRYVVLTLSLQDLRVQAYERSARTMLRSTTQRVDAPTT